MGSKITDVVGKLFSQGETFVGFEGEGDSLMIVVKLSKFCVGIKIVSGFERTAGSKFFCRFWWFAFLSWDPERLRR